MPRIRLQSCAPLPTLKVWFFVPDNIQNIRDVKCLICSQLTTLKDTHLQPEQLTLEMEDFEILDESPVDLVREADIVMLKIRDSVMNARHILKRKFDAKDTISIETKRRKISSRVIPPTSKSSSTSSSSDSDTTTSSNSESTTSADSETTSSSESSSSVTNSQSKSSSHLVLSASATKEKPSFKPAISPMTNRIMMRSTPLAVVQDVTVPPGCGKPSTQARNRRRRLKRRFEADKGSPGITSVPGPIADKEGENASVLSYGDSLPTSAAPLCTLGNRNKRKGFKKSMEGVLPEKVVFNSTTVPTFIPPSEREVLPHNLFVTSVDVEWRTGRGRRQDVEGVGTSPVPEMKVALSGNGEPGSQKGMDWMAIEAEWEKCSRIEAVTEVPLGSIVAWKGFGIDPMTLTPQAALLHLGKVIAGDSETLTVSLLVRPGIGPATFGRADVTDETEDEPAGQVSMPLTEIWSGDWRVVFNE